MKNRFVRKNLLVSLTAVLLVVLCVLVTVLIHVNPGFTRQGPAVTPFYLLKPENVSEEPISGYAGVQYVYTFTLPELSPSGSSGLRLTAFLHHTYASFSVDGSGFSFSSEETEKPHIGKTPGKYWLNIPMLPEFSGKSVRLVLTPVFRNVRTEGLNFLLISRDTLLTQMVLPEDGLLLFLGGLSVMAGLILAVMVLFIPADGRDKRLVFSIGLVTIFAALWKLSGLPVVALLFDYMAIHKEVWYAGTLCYLLMLVFSLNMMSCMGKEQPDRIGEFCFFLSAAAAVLLVVLQMTGLIELHDVTIGFGVGVALMHLVILLKRKAGRSEWLWVLPFFLTMVADLLVYLVTGSMQAAPFFMLWLILNLFIRGFGFVRQAVLRERTLRKKEEELHEAKVRTMINQIQPHFIYNTLSSIYLLCQDDPDKAARVVENFSEYLEGNFTAIASSELTAFSNELQHTRAYLSVVSVLYGDSLAVEYDTEYTAFRIPPLTLQPLVENSVKFGVAKGHTPGRIFIRSRAVENGSEVIVEDNGPGFSPAVDDKTHVGLRNVRERLDLLCGGTLEIDSPSGGGTVARIFIPSENNPERIG